MLVFKFSSLSFPFADLSCFFRIIASFEFTNIIPIALIECNSICPGYHEQLIENQPVHIQFMYIINNLFLIAQPICTFKLHIKNKSGFYTKFNYEATFLSITVTGTVWL